MENPTLVVWDGLWRTPALVVSGSKVLLPGRMDTSKLMPYNDWIEANAPCAGELVESVTASVRSAQPCEWITGVHGTIWEPPELELLIATDGDVHYYAFPQYGLGFAERIRGRLLSCAEGSRPAPLVLHSTPAYLETRGFDWPGPQSLAVPQQLVDNELAKSVRHSVIVYEGVAASNGLFYRLQVLPDSDLAAVVRADD